eukprot:4183013-Pyramimonas_sp.AAC.1
MKRREQGPCWVVADACVRCHSDLRWSPIWGNETLSWVDETQGAMAVLRGCARSGATGTFGGAPIWGLATLYWVGATH